MQRRTIGSIIKRKYSQYKFTETLITIITIKDLKTAIINTLKNLEEKMDQTGEQIVDFSREMETVKKKNQTELPEEKNTYLN